MPRTNTFQNTKLKNLFFLPLLSVNVFFVVVVFEFPVYTIYIIKTSHKQKTQNIYVFIYIYMIFYNWWKRNNCDTLLYAVIYIEKIQIDRFLPLMF